MLKKAGIIVAAAAATLLAVSPLAFAGEGGDNWGQDDHGSSVTTNNNGESSKGGLLNLSDNNVTVPVQACNNDVPIQGGAGQLQVPVKNVTGALSGALALFGHAESNLEQATDNSRSCGDNKGASGDVADQHVG